MEAQDCYNVRRHIGGTVVQPSEKGRDFIQRKCPILDLTGPVGGHPRYGVCGCVAFSHRPRKKRMQTLPSRFRLPWVAVCDIVKQARDVSPLQLVRKDVEFGCERTFQPPRNSRSGSQGSAPAVG